MQRLQHPLPVFTGKCAVRSLCTPSESCAHLLDSLFWGVRGLPDVTVGLPLPEDGRPLFGVWNVVLTSMREDASFAWNCLLFIISLLDILRALQSCLFRSHYSEDDCVPEDVHIPATGFDGELVFGCPRVKQIHTSHVLVVGTNNVGPINPSVGSGSFVPALNLLHRFSSSKGWHKCDGPVVIPLDSTDVVIPLHSDVIASSPFFLQALLVFQVTVGQAPLPGLSNTMTDEIFFQPVITVTGDCVFVCLWLDVHVISWTVHGWLVFFVHLLTDIFI